MRKIIRVDLDVGMNVPISVAKGAVLLHVGWRNGPAMYFQVDTEKEVVQRQVNWYRNEDPLPAKVGNYLGTVTAPETLITYHAFEVRP